METKKNKFMVFYKYTLTMRSGNIVECIDAADPNEIPILMDMETEGLSANGITKTFVKCLNYGDARKYVIDLKVTRDKAYKTFKWHSARGCHKLTPYLNNFHIADKAFNNALKILEENYNI